MSPKSAFLFLSGSGGVTVGCCGSYCYLNRNAEVQSSVNEGTKVDKSSSDNERVPDVASEALIREPKAPVVKWWQVRVQAPEDDDDEDEFEEEMSEGIEGKLSLVKEADSDWVGQHIYKLIPSFEGEAARPEGIQFELPFTSPKNEREINKLTEDINGETIVTPDSISDVLSTFKGNKRKLIEAFGTFFFEQLIQEVQKLQDSN